MKTFDTDPRVVEALLSGDARARRTKGKTVDSYALAYRIYPQESTAPLLRIASHAERPSIPGLGGEAKQRGWSRLDAITARMDAAYAARSKTRFGTAEYAAANRAVEAVYDELREFNEERK